MGKNIDIIILHNAKVSGLSAGVNCYLFLQEVDMAYCSKCGGKLEEVITYTPKTHKENGREFHCSVHGVDKSTIVSYTGRTNPGNKAGRDWGVLNDGK